jgi:hypothetical protein
MLTTIGGPVALDEVAARELTLHAGAAQPLEGFSLAGFGGRPVGEQGAAASLDTQRPVCAGRSPGLV